MSTATATKKTVSVPPFGIEADHPRNCDVLIQTVENCKLRSRITPTKMVFDRDRETGEQIERPADAELIDGLPEIPGMQIHVNPAECTYVILDPLENDERMCERIKRALDESSPVRTRSRIRGVPSRSGTVSADRMKTLVRELYQIVEAGEASVKKGPRPDIEDIVELPGDFLLEPRPGHGYNRPRYEKDLREWVESLNRLK